MKPERWQKLEQIYQAALEREKDQRDAYLNEACAGNDSLRREVESLLACESEARDFIESPALGDLTGRTLSHYRITEKLGAGGMGVVYKAVDSRLNRSVVLKVLPPEKMTDPERKRRFVKEAKAASALNHPNIVIIHDSDQVEGIDFIVMEYVAGKSLHELIPRSGMKIDRALKIAVQIAEGLTQAHKAGIIHRDLKPSNIMVGGEGLVKILDFGLAKLTERESPSGQEGGQSASVSAETEKGTIAGTAAYMSPEQAEGRPIDSRSDIFSFGSVLYEMVSGRRAFRGDTAASTLASVIKQEPARLADNLPEELKRVIGRCLRKDPNRRFQHVEDLRVALEELIEEYAAAPSSTPKRRGWLTATVLLILLSAGTGLLLWYSSRTTPPPRVVALTAYPGSESYPSLSPDGKLVAFSWDGEKHDNLDIWVQQIESPTPLRLTTNPRADILPAWSPGGSRIAYVSAREGGRAIYLISPLGGQPVKLADYRPTFPDSQLSWSPDGKWLAAAELESDETSGIFLIPVGQGERRKLISGPVSQGRFYSPAFSGDGHYLAYALVNDLGSGHLRLLELNSHLEHKGPDRRLTKEVDWIYGIAWAPDQRSLIYGARYSDSIRCLWRTMISGDTRRERLDLAAEGAAWPTVSPGANRLAYRRGSDAGDSDIWTLDAAGPRKHPVSSTRPESSPALSPDGQKIAFCSARAGRGGEIWVSNRDGSGMVRLTDRADRFSGSPRWSPDGRWIAFDGTSEDGHWDIFIIGAAGGSFRRLTSYPTDEHNPTWSRDGKWIYFTSNRTGRFEIWRMPWEGGEAVQITRDGGLMARESWDGRSLFYVKDPRPSAQGLYVRPVPGGTERRILGSLLGSQFSPVDGGVYYVTKCNEEGPYVYKLWFLDSATEKSRLENRFEAGTCMHLTVSPDRKTILYAGTAPGSNESDLMLIENFR